MLLAAEPGLEVVGEAANGKVALDLVEVLKPDLVLMDLHMPVMDGLAATRKIVDQSQNVIVVLISLQDDAFAREQAREAGAAAFIAKDSVADRLPSLLLKLAGSAEAPS